MSETPESDKFLAKFADTGDHAATFMRSFERELRNAKAILAEIAAQKRFDPNAKRSPHHARTTINLPRELVERLDAAVRGEAPSGSVDRG